MHQKPGCTRLAGVAGGATRCGHRTGDQTRLEKFVLFLQVGLLPGRQLAEGIFGHLKQRLEVLVRQVLLHNNKHGQHV